MYRSGSPAAHFPTDPEITFGDAVNSMESNPGSFYENFTCCGMLLMDLHVLIEHFEMHHVFVAGPKQPQVQLRHQPPILPPVSFQAKSFNLKGNGTRADLSLADALGPSGFNSSSNSQASSTRITVGSVSSKFGLHAIDMEVRPEVTTPFAFSIPSSFISIPNSSTRSSTRGDVAGALPLIQPLLFTSADSIGTNGIRISSRNPSGTPLPTMSVTPFAYTPSGVVKTTFPWTAPANGELVTPTVYPQIQYQDQGQVHPGPSPFDADHFPSKHNNDEIFSHPYANASSTAGRAYAHPLLPSSSSSSGLSISGMPFTSSGYSPSRNAFGGSSGGHVYHGLHGSHSLFALRLAMHTAEEHEREDVRVKLPERALNGHPGYEDYVRWFPGTGNVALRDVELGGQVGMDDIGPTESAVHPGPTFLHGEDLLQAEEDVLQNVVDVIQLAIKLDEIYGIRKLNHFLTHTAEKRGIFPSAIFLSGVSRIGNNYVFGGGFADVWKGLYKGKEVALKILRIFNRADREKMQIDISKEALLWRKLDHPNILPFIGICRDVFEPQMALVSPWIEKGSLVQYLEDNPQADRLKLAIGLAHGLAYLHSLKPQILHGDLRGANVLVDENDKPRITDFGLSRAIDSRGTSIPASFKAGTLHWQAPELIRVARFGEVSGKLTAKSDVYSFSCLCYEIFTGKAPFYGLRDGQVIQLVVTMNRRPPWPGNAAVLRGLSNDIWSIMQLCWKPQPSDRPDMPFVVSRLRARVYPKSARG